MQLRHDRHRGDGVDAAEAAQLSDPLGVGRLHGDLRNGLAKAGQSLLELFNGAKVILENDPRAGLFERQRSQPATMVLGLVLANAMDEAQAHSSAYSAGGRFPSELCGRTWFYVVQARVLDLATGVCEAGEPVEVQIFMSQAAVETLHDAVLDRLAGLDEHQGHLVLVGGPGIEGLAGEPRSIVHHDSHRVTTAQRRALQYTHDTMP